MRKTKIVATIGPASSDPAVFAAMCKAGVNVARLNFSHGTHEEQLAKIHMIKKVREELDLPIAIMLDTKGPEYRTGTFKNGKVHINDGDLFTFTTRDVEGSSTIVSVSYKNLAQDVHPGSQIMLDDGLISMKVLERTETVRGVVCVGSRCESDDPLRKQRAEQHDTKEERTDSFEKMFSHTITFLLYIRCLRMP